MIEYDYILKKNEIDEVVTYKPKAIPKELPNLVYIEGPNSSGKSTLLHILALSFYGNRNRLIKESLHEKIDNLLNGERNNLSFSVKVKNDRGEVILTAEKRDFKNKEITLRDADNHLISFSQFEAKYNLIYDIPENPTKRIKELTREIKRMQDWFYQQLGILRSELVQTINDIRTAKDPQKIESVSKEIQVLEIRKNDKEKNLKTSEQNLQEIKLFTYLKFFKTYIEKEQVLNKSDKEIKKADSKKRRESQKINKNYNEILNNIANERNAIIALYASVTPSIRDFFKHTDEKHRVKMWEDINISEELQEPELFQTLKIEGSHFKNLLEIMDEEESKEKNFQEATVFRKLIEVLENYSNLRITIPGADLTISKFVEILQSKIREYDALFAKRRKIRRTIDDLNSILEKRELIGKMIFSAKKIAKEQPSASEMIDEGEAERIREQKLKHLLSECSNKLAYYKAELLKLGLKNQEQIDEFYPSIVLGKALAQRLSNYSEADLLERIFSIELDISKDKEEINKINSNLSYLTREKSNLEEKKAHPYHSHRSFLESTLAEVQQLESKIHSFGRCIDKLEKDMTSIKLDTCSFEEKKYYKKLFEYLGRRVHRIRHIDRDYEISEINLITNCILTKEGKEIKIEDMGTGQSQSAFLTGLLNTDDNRKIIALFDEVAMMDEKSLAPVYYKLKELYKRGKLLMGVIVQKADNPKIEPII